MRVNDKRLLAKTSFDAGSLQWGFSLAQAEPLSGDGDPDLNLTSSFDGQGVDATLVKIPIGTATTFRVNGPGAALDSSTGKLTTRLFGFGVTREATASDGQTRLQASAEVRVTPQTVVEAAAMAAPASLHAAQTMLGGATSALSTGVQHGLATLLPALAVGLAAHSIDKAAAELERPEATFSDKVFALARAVGDTVRIVDVVVGTVISAVAAAASAGWAWFKAWRRR